MDVRENWEMDVNITRIYKKSDSKNCWEASDGITWEVGRTPNEALEGLWELRKEEISKEHKEMLEEMKNDEKF